jgi:EPS-associated MarR family transcriptional regulator
MAERTPAPELADEVRYRLLKYLDGHPGATQRELATALGVSLGKINYCVKALIFKGWLKMQNFRNSDNKMAYAYVLTRQGMEEKVNVTYGFLRRKVAEYDALAKEIEDLTREVGELAEAERAPGQTA